MYDALTARYTFACPAREQAHVALSSFRLLERLPGAAHPAVYEVRFDCSCGEEHPGLVSHDDLDWAPLGGHAGAFVDLMTSRIVDAPPSSRDRRRAPAGGGVAVELLLLSGGAAAAGLPVLVRRRRARASAGWGSRSAARSATRCR